MIDLSDVVRQLCKDGKGILAADESTGTADKRLASYGIEPDVEMRRKFRDLFLAAPGVETYLSGVILYEETLMQDALDGTPFPEALHAHGIIPGIKVDQGTEPFPESPDELITKGLIGLPERLAEFVAKYKTGFTKWRSVVRIDGDRLPTASALLENAKRLASYARMVQEAGMVPIVEPEVLLEGNHSRLRAKEVIQETLAAVVAALEDNAVDLSGTIVKTSMAVSGSKSGHTDTPEEVAEATLDALLAALPKGLGGVVFLSGGQTSEQATANLAAITKRAKAQNAPWPLTFSFARALQDEALTAWAGKDENVEVARTAFLARLKKTSDALAP